MLLFRSKAGEKSISRVPFLRRTSVGYIPFKHCYNITTRRSFHIPITKVCLDIIVYVIPCDVAVCYIRYYAEVNLLEGLSDEDDGRRQGLIFRVFACRTILSTSMSHGKPQR